MYSNESHPVGNNNPVSVCFTSLSLVLIKAGGETIKAPESSGPAPDRQPQRLLHKHPSALLKLLLSQQLHVLLGQIQSLLSHQLLGQPAVLHLGSEVVLPQRQPLFPVDDSDSGEAGAQQDVQLHVYEGEVGGQVAKLWDSSVHLPAVVGDVGVVPQVVPIEDGHILEK